MIAKVRKPVWGIAILALLLVSPFILKGLEQKVYPPISVANNGDVPIDNQSIIQRWSLSPLAFTENQGQWDKSVQFPAPSGIFS